MVLPRTSPSDHIAVAVGTSEFEKHAAGMPDDAMALFLIFAGLGFLYPALTALRLGRHWHGGVFAIMAMLCVAYQYMVMNFKVADIQPLLILAQHGWSYFCLLQTLFMVLGPEDPSMQWIDYQGAVKKSGESLCPAPPFHVQAAGGFQRYPENCSLSCRCTFACDANRSYWILLMFSFTI